MPKNPNTVTGWAVARDGGVFVATVSPHRRAAIVNYLVVVHGISITQGWSDREIENVWESYAPQHSASVIEVEITPIGEVPHG